MNLNGTKRYKVCVFPAGFSGCSWWRIRNPLNMVMKKHPDMEIILLNTDSMTKEDCVREPMKADLIVFQSPGSEIALDLINFYKNNNKKVILEYDDYSFDPSPYNPRYKDLGLKEVMARDKDGNLTWAWRDGWAGFDLKSNLKRFEFFKMTCRLADAITVTTDYLGKYFKEFNKNIVVLPNSIDFNKWKVYPKPDRLKDQIRIGWFGGDSHFKDLDIIKPVFKNVVDKYPNVKWVFLGSDQWKGTLFKDIPPERVEYHGWNGLDVYPLIISTMFWDIGICPLQDTEFNKCKSNIKWLEYGALSTPSICTDMLPYNKEITNMQNGVLSVNEKFEESLSNLIENKELRTFIGQNALNYTKQHYDLYNNCSLWYNLYKSILEQSKFSIWSKIKELVTR